MIDLSIIIPSYNGKEKLPVILASIDNQIDSSKEVIVVIDGSTDGSAESISGLGYNYLKIIEQHNQGRGSARNTGANEAKGKLLLFLDDDMELLKGSIAAHLAHHRIHPNSILVGSQPEDLAMCRSDFQRFKAYLSRRWISSLALKKKKLSRPFIAASHFSIPSALFETIDGFDSRLKDTEDYDLALKATKKGIPIFFDPELIAWHHDYPDFRRFVKRQREYLASSSLHAQLNDIPTVSTSLVKRIFFYLFNFRFWVKLIESDSLTWLPQKMRYKLYDWVVTSYSLYFPNSRFE